MEILLCEDKEIKNIAKAIIKYIKIKKLKPILLVGNDGNVKNHYIFALFQSILLKNGVEIHNLNTCIYPCIKYIQNKHNYPLSLMIGISENNKIELCFNSIKNNFNQKEFVSILNNKSSLKNNNFQPVKDVQNLKQDYYSYLKQHINFSFPIIINNTYPTIKELCNNIFPKHQKVNDINLLKLICTKQQKLGLIFNKYTTETRLVLPNHIKIEAEKQIKNNDVVLSAITYLNKIQLKKG